MNEKPEKKVYEVPRLTIYGSLTDMTRGTGGGMPDNGHAGKPKT